MEVDLAIRDASGKIRTQRVAWLPKRASDGPGLAGVIIHTRPEVVQWISGDILKRVLMELQREHAIGHFLNPDKGTISIVLNPANIEHEAIDKLLVILRELEDKIRSLEEALQQVEAAS